MASITSSALARAVHDIERHVAKAGWDAPVRLFALIDTAGAMAADPRLAAELGPEAVADALASPGHLTAVEQEDLPPAESLEELLGTLGWGSSVAGCAVAVERIVVPDAAAERLPADEEEALTRLMSDPQRQDVRMVAGALRTGERWCAIRARAVDEDDAVAGGEDLAPALTDALSATFE